MDINMIKHADHIRRDNVKDLLTEVSKETCSDLKELIGDHTPTVMKYTVNTFISPVTDNSTCVTIFSVHVSDGQWSADDVFAHVFRSSSVSIKNMEKVISDMADYYKKNILKLED